MNKSYSLYKITEEEKCPFQESEYSWFKFGDKFYAEKFAKQLSEGFISQYQELLLSTEKEIVILPSPYLSIPTASNFLCTYFKRDINNFLFQNDKKTSVESKIYRNQTYVTDYGQLDFEERMKLIANDTYYVDKSFIDGKLCLFVDDIKITGSHEFTVDRILKEHQVTGDFLFVYFAELANKEIHPKIENYYNYFSVKGVDEIVNVVNREHFQYNTRIVKYILKLTEDEFSFLLENISTEKMTTLFHLAISNNYHQVTEYKNNINKIKINYGN